MQRMLLTVALLCVPAFGTAKEKPRPKITGIVQVRILVTNVRQAHDFYYGLFEALPQDTHFVSEAPCNWCERIPAGLHAPVELEQVKGELPKNLIASVAFRTDNAEELRKLLKRRRLKVGKLTKWPHGATFSVVDPENHHLIFVEGASDTNLEGGIPGAYASQPNTWAHAIIHVGWVVKDPVTMDKFYRDILGFHLYWHGGMKEGETDWVDMQVPDGSDWIEYMLNVPANADQQLRGVMNHIAIGVKDIHAADEALLANKVKLDIKEEPKIGRDGKWQLNLYDPDQTRVELMELTPVEKPCCSQYTGAHPKP
jgi:catechol 2,3-dioxygenase-like lactoylglutathione lyase family enzyme